MTGPHWQNEGIRISSALAKHFVYLYTISKYIVLFHVDFFGKVPPPQAIPRAALLSNLGPKLPRDLVRGHRSPVPRATTLTAWASTSSSAGHHHGRKDDPFC